MKGASHGGGVVAAIDRDGAAASVLATAGRFAKLTGAGVDAVHVGPSVPATLAVLAARAGMSLRAVAGPTRPALLAELERPEVLAIVLGAGDEHRGHHVVGPTTRHVTERSTKPVVVVPATGIFAGDGLHRLLVPLEGQDASSRPVLEALLPLLVEGVDIEVLHVFTEETLPRMLDRPQRDVELLGREFLARHCPDATRIALRAGTIADRVREICEERAADLVVLSWSQVSTGGRARVVRDVLECSSLPVLLLPVAGEAGRTALLEPSLGRAR